MKIELLENSREFRGGEDMKGLPCHFNKSALQAAKKYGAVADSDQSIKSIRGIHLCFEQRVGCLWSVLLLSYKQNQPLHPVRGMQTTWICSLCWVELQKVPREYQVTNDRKQGFQGPEWGHSVTVFWVLGSSEHHLIMLLISSKGIKKKNLWSSSALETKCDK